MEIQAQDPQSEQLAAPFCRPIAPPFTGSAGWERFRTVTPPPGFWMAVRQLDLNGDLVMQLGRRQTGAAPLTRGTIEVGWQQQVTAPFLRLTSFQAGFKTGPITVLPNGGFASAELFLELWRGRYRVASAQKLVTRLHSHQMFRLSIEAPEPGTYLLKVGGRLTEIFFGEPRQANPYAEIIAWVADVQRCLVRLPLEPLQETAAAGLREADEPAQAPRLDDLDQAFATSQRQAQEAAGVEECGELEAMIPREPAPDREN